MKNQPNMGQNLRADVYQTIPPRSADQTYNRCKKWCDVLKLFSFKQESFPFLHIGSISYYIFSDSLGLFLITKSIRFKSFNPIKKLCGKLKTRVKILENIHTIQSFRLLLDKKILKSTHAYVYPYYTPHYN